MPLLHTREHIKFSEHGPVPRPLHIGPGLAVMLLCLQNGQELVAPENDHTETIFTVLQGSGSIREGDVIHAVQVGDVVHIEPGSQKTLIAGDGEFVVLGTRRLKDKRA